MATSVRGLEDQWTRGAGPWKTARDGDRLYGRGTADNKGQHTINMAAMRAVLETRGKLGFNAKFMVETGEENGSAGVYQVVAANKDAFSADVFIASDGPRVKPDRPTVCFGARGALNFDLVCRLREGGHHSGNWGGALADPAAILCARDRVDRRPHGQILIKEWLPPQITNATREALKGVELDGGPTGPKVDRDWGEPGLTPAEKVYAWNSFAVLAMLSGNPPGPVNAIQPLGQGPCQLRYIAGTDVANVFPALRRHLDAHGFGQVEVLPPPPGNARWLSGQPHRARSPLGGLGTRGDRAGHGREARDHPADGRLDLQRRLHRPPRPAGDLDPAFLCRLLAARPRRAHPDAALPRGAGDDGVALLGSGRGRHAGRRMTRAAALARARAWYNDPGGYFAELAVRVAVPTESQRPERLPELYRYLRKIMAPSFEAQGYAVRIYDNPVAGCGPVLLAHRDEGAALTVLGYGHGDVIRGMEGEWANGRDPWALAFEGDRVYGRGVADNKGQTLAHQGAAAAVMAERGKLGFNHKFIVEMGEENGSRGFRELVQAHGADFAADVYFASDGPRTEIGRPNITLGNRGVVNFDLVCDLRPGGHHSGNWGGLLANPGVLVAQAIAAIGTLAVPVIGTFSSALILGERVGWREFAAMALVCGALATVLVLPALRRGAARR